MELARFVVLLLSLALALAVQTSSSGAETGTKDVAEMVTATRYEGITFSDVANLTAEDVQQLEQMLGDPEYVEAQHRLVAALGKTGRRDACAALLRFSASEPVGRVRASQFRARVGVRLMMGELARDYEEALDYLIREHGRAIRSPRWAHGRLSEERVSQVLRASALTALGTSGHPRAGEYLRQVRASARPESLDRTGADRALILHEKSQLERR